MVSLIFLSGKMCEETHARRTKIPLTPICLATVKGKLFSSPYDSFILDETTPGPYGNSVVYGMIFQLDNSEHYLRVIDSIMTCYLVGSDNEFDFRQRRLIPATPIRASNLNDLQRLKYRELSQIKVEGWFGNMRNERVRSYVYDYHNQYRIQSGVSHSLYKQLLINFKRKEVINHE